jgi:uncharacterized repeat protein (TIGR01451 family)
VNPNGSITYTITVTNNGPSVATNVSVTDALPAGLTSVTVSNGGTNVAGAVTWPTIASLAVGTAAAQTYTISATAPASGTLANKVSSTSATTDPNAANNDGSATASQVSTTITPLTSADVVTTATGPASVNPNGSITYTITVTNNGPSAAANVSVTDVLPAGLTNVVISNGGTNTAGAVTWPTIASLANGTTQTYTISATAPASGTLLNKVSSTSDTADPTPANNNGSAPQVTTAISVAPTIAKSFAPASIAPSGISTLTITLSNTNATAATLTSVLTDTFPAGVTVAPAPTNLSGTCTGTKTATAGGGSVSYASGSTIPPNGSCTIIVNVTSSTAGTVTNSIPASALVTKAITRQRLRLT